jgi:hypothetical protein
MQTATRRTCRQAIGDLMSDGKPRSARMIAAATGYSHSRIRHDIKHFNFATKRHASQGPKIGGRETWYRLKDAGDGR